MFAITKQESDFKSGIYLSTATPYTHARYSPKHALGQVSR